MEKVRIGEGIRRYTFDELKEEMTEEDALFAGTAAFVISMNWIDYQRLKKHLSMIPEFRVVYKTFSTTHLRIVKVEQYDEYLLWRKNKENKDGI